MRRKMLLLTVALAVLATTALGSHVYFADSTGQRIGRVCQGGYIYVLIEDPDRAACNIDQFQADVVLLDPKTGAWWTGRNLWFSELAGIGSGKYFLVREKGSSTKVELQIGSLHMLGDLGPTAEATITGRRWADLISPAPAMPGLTGEKNPLDHPWVERGSEYPRRCIGMGTLPGQELAAWIDLRAWFGLWGEEDDPGIILDVPSALRLWGRSEVTVIARDTGVTGQFSQNVDRIIDSGSELAALPSTQPSVDSGVAAGQIHATRTLLQAALGDPESPDSDTKVVSRQDPPSHSSMLARMDAVGSSGPLPPECVIRVRFDKAYYNVGEIVTITVTDERYAGQREITGTKPLVLKRFDGTTLAEWTSIPAVAGEPMEFRVRYALPADVTGAIAVFYVDPMVSPRSASAQALVAAELSRVTAVRPLPGVFSGWTTFTALLEPAGAVVDSLRVAVYDLTGEQVAALAGAARSNTIAWSGATLRNGAYVYVAEAVGAHQVWIFRGYVYIKR